MTRVVKIDTSSGSTISYKYPLVNVEDIPQKFETVPISIKASEIQEYDVIFFHRLLKRIYGSPSFIEVEELPTKDGQIGHLGVEWKYFLSTQFGDMILVETKEQHTSIQISHVLLENNQLAEKAIREGEKFVNALLLEASRLGKQILNPKKEFEQGKGIQLYLLHNVYLYNYGSADLMLEYSQTHEEKIQRDFLKYDAKTELDDPQKRAHIDKFMLGIGMYYASVISYYFMALEGFINLIYHAFLKPELRDKEFNLEERFDIEQKIRLMPSLCDGFHEEYLDRESALYTNFKKLKKYRNQIFHSKIQDSLKKVTFVESGFLYTADMDKNRNQIFPSQKYNLNKENVLTVKSIVDDIISDILSRMTDRCRSMINEFIMKNTEVPFWKDNSGTIKLGNLDSKQ